MDLYLLEDSPAEPDPEPSLSQHSPRSDLLRGGQTLSARMLWNQRPRDHDDAMRQLYTRHGLMRCMRKCISLCVAGLTEERINVVAHWGLGNLAPVCARFACTDRLWYFASRLVFHIANLAPWWPVSATCTDHWSRVDSWFYACPWYIERGEMARTVYEWKPIMPGVQFEDLPSFPANRLLCCYAGREDDSDTEAPHLRKRQQPGSDSPSTAAIDPDTFGTPLCRGAEMDTYMSTTKQRAPRRRPRRREVYRYVGTTDKPDRAPSSCVRCGAHPCQCPTPDPDAPGTPPCDSSPDTPPCDRCGAHSCQCSGSSSLHFVTPPPPGSLSSSD